MPPYSAHSPSLRKMEGYGNGRRDTYGGGYGSGKRFSFGNIVGDPFALATISIAIVRSLKRDMHGLKEEY